MRIAASTDSVILVQNAADRAIRLPNPLLDQVTYNKGTQSLERWNGSGWVSDINSSAGLPTFASSAARDAAYPAPAVDQKAYRTDTKVIERYNGTTWAPDITSGNLGLPVASKAARDAQVPSPAAGNQVTRTDYGAIERYTGSVWVADTSSKMHENPIGQGADPTGVADSRAAFAAVEALGRDIAVAKGTYRIASNITLAAHYHFEKGAVLKPDAGVVVTFNGCITAGHYQLFDVSAVGSIVNFQSNRSLQEIKAFWWGIVADDVTDDSAHMNAVAAAVRWYQRVQFPIGAYTIALANTWVIVGSKEGVRFTTGLDVRQGDVNGAPVLKWTGPAGGRMVLMDRTCYAAVEGFRFNANGLADVGIDLDGYGGNQLTFTNTLSINTATDPRIVNDSGGGFTTASVGQRLRVNGAGPGGVAFYGYIVTRNSANQVVLDPGMPGASTSVTNVSGATDESGGIGTSCTIRHNYFGNFRRASTVVAIRISNTVTQNQEYHKIERNQINGPGWTESGSATYVSGNTTVTLSGGHNPDAFWVGRRIICVGAGVAGATLDTTVASVVDGTHITLTAAPSTSTTNTFQIGLQLGAGIKIGQSPNAKSIQLEWNGISGFDKGIWQLNGSHHANFTSFTDNLHNIYIEGSTEPSSEIAGNSEYSWQHISDASGNSFDCVTPRTDVSHVAPGGASALYYRINGSGGVTFVRGAEIENADAMALKTGVYLLSGKISIDSLSSGATVLSAMLQDPGNTLPLFFGHMTNLGAPLNEFMRRWQGPSAFYSLGPKPGATSIIDSASGAGNGAGSNEFTAHAGEARLSGGGPTPQYGIGYDAPMGSASQTDNHAYYRGFRAVGAADPSGTMHFLENIGFTMVPPNLAAGATLAAIYASYVPALKTPGVTAAHGHYQLGFGEDNLFNGPTAFGSKLTVKVVAATVAAAGTDTFDASTLAVRRITANGSITVANPTNTPADGDLLTLDILNNTAGAITVTLGTAFLGTFPAGAAGKRRTQQYVYDGTATKWVPNGGQSGDL